MTRDEETRLWIKTHLRQIERPEEVDDYLLAYRAPLTAADLQPLPDVLVVNGTRYRKEEE